MAVQYRQKFFHKNVVTVNQAFDVVGIPVVSDDGRDGGKQPHGGGDQDLTTL